MSELERDTRDRVIAVEQQVKHLDEKFDEKFGKFEVKLDEMHDMFMQGKGGWKLILGFAAFIGFLSGVAAWLVPPFFHR